METGQPYPYELLSDPAELARLGFWSPAVYHDFLALESGAMNEAEFKARYGTTAAIMCLDMTKFTKTAIERGEIFALLRILDVQKVVTPVLRKHQARHIRVFADDFTAIFDNPHAALDAAFEIHHRIRVFNASAQGHSESAECCIGIGYGEVLAIGIDQAMGDEMNRASKLGEDTADAGETLVTERVYNVIKDRSDCEVRRRMHEELPFPFYQVLYRQ
ncbi:MAG: adenylate/guanylate cyclase domain-containing protein [Leptospiraceae bacterium]|nr:adenylate/guanylate cyclase domain-containing protein [Leptospiraceae bacterium]